MSVINFKWLNSKYCKTVAVKFIQDGEMKEVRPARFQVKENGYKLILYPVNQTGVKYELTPEQVLDIKYTKDIKVLKCLGCGAVITYKTCKKKKCKICGGDLVEVMW